MRSIIAGMATIIIMAALLIATLLYPRLTMQYITLALIGSTTVIIYGTIKQCLS